MHPNRIFSAVLAVVAGVVLGTACSGVTADEEPAEVTDDSDAAPPDPTAVPTGTNTGGTPPIYNFPTDPIDVGPVCGDGVIDPGEGCDDGNVAALDGCSDVCALEPGFICLEPGVSCFAEICGDGSRTASESCDDSNINPGDGCDAACQVEAGWVCPSQGMACLPKCGDSVLVGSERCDDGNTANGDGCGAGCLVEPGWFDCPPAGSGCQLAVCGNGVIEANEGCDDTNDISGDGCNASCLREPVFDAGQAVAVCGDGARTLGEACDDGNVLDGDGCSAACTIEAGFECVEEADEPEFVRLPVVYRDFTDEHPDFEYVTGRVVQGITGEVCTVDNTATCGRLDDERKPVMADGTHRSVNEATDFAQWYRDIPDVNQAIPGALELTRLVENGNTVYRFESDEFFPLDGLGFGDYEDSGHNYHFTTELQYFIQYEGGELLEFAGDDDVWIYVNGHLAVDIGGVHDVAEAFVLLGDEDGDGVLSAEEEADPTDDRFGITKGQLYSIHLFHAERHTIWSNFKLTLSNFILSWSVCTPICGSGTIEPGEFCDDGAELNTGEYGACSTDCSGREFCGDGIIQGDEECDDGLNQSPYNSVGEACAPGCRSPARCGDGNVDREYGETCDRAEENGVKGSDCDLECNLVEIIQ